MRVLTCAAPEYPVWLRAIRGQLPPDRKHKNLQSRLLALELRARIDAARIVLDPPSNEDSPNQATIEQPIARMRARHASAVLRCSSIKCGIYATLLAHGRNTCPEAEIVATSEVRS